MIKELMFVFLQPSATLRRVRVRILSIAVLRGREKAFSSWNTRFIFEITPLSRERPCADSEVPVLSVTTKYFSRYLKQKETGTPQLGR